MDPALDLHEAIGSLQLGYDNECPTVVDLDPEEPSLSFSYFTEEQRARAAVAAIERYLPVFERHGWVPYDPQLDGPFDAERALEVHGGGPHELAVVEMRPRRPWWRRLLGD